MSPQIAARTLGADLDFIANVKPTDRQLAWQSTEFYGFIHFGLNTFTDREWGEGTDSPEIFNPQDLDADQWVAAMKAAGMRGVILTAKHHDGFCLWPSKYTDYSVAASPWRDGQGDLVAEVADAARRHGLKLGIYLSPWDRHEPCYGTGRDYDDFYVAQLSELLTNYGPVFSVWLDGANGEGPNGRKQHYDWDRYYRVIRSLQPGAVISVCGPDVRWCGNEAGHTRQNEWSVVPASLRDAERTAEKSQQVDDGVFSRQVRSDEEDLGSREALAQADTDPVWYPAEVNTSIRPGWFYHASEDDKVRTPQELFAIYCGSVGGNATFLLNLPPNRGGLLAQPDLDSLNGLGQLVGDFYAHEVTAASVKGVPSEGDHPWHAYIDLPQQTAIRAVILGEDIRSGQRVESVTVEGRVGDTWQELAAAQSVGYRRILFTGGATTDSLRITVNVARGEPHLSDIRVIAEQG